MIITFSGCDGVGKSTHTRMLADRIAHKQGLSVINLYDVLDYDMTYNNDFELDNIYDRIKKYDVIVSRFYLKGREYQEVQNKVRYCDEDSIFSNNELIWQTVQLMKKDAKLWFDKVISKLIYNNKIVIFDRYYYDEFAYRTLYNLPMFKIEEEFKEFYSPDVSLLLTADLESINDRNVGRQDSNTILFQKSDKLQELLNNFDLISKRHHLKNIIVGNRNIEEVNDEIFSYIESKLITL